ncbi:imelysin family protein [Runella sp.]|uniref:imelysin family protein n=1 Tax=Runella sp. TaxID=1960881 RepID=UPI0026227214|nr:imelysin family protein [Runella sp.]
MIVVCLLAGIIWACSGKGSNSDPDPDKGTTDRKAVLINLADNSIIPAYANYKVKQDAMLIKSQAFLSKPDITTLTAFRQAWVDAYTEWQKVELFDIGPANKTAIVNYYNIYPTSVAGINEYIADPTVNLEVTASYDKQGFPALDYLLNGVGTTDAEILAFYTSSANGTKRLAYIKRITDHMDALLTKVINDWKSTYREEFTTKTGLDIGSPMGQLVNGYVLHYERFLRSGKFGIPSGAMLNGVVSAEKVEGFYKKDISKQLAQTAHQAAVDFFNGKNAVTGASGPSFKTYLDGLGAKDSATRKTLSEIINAQFEVVNQKINVLKPSIYEEVKTNNAAVVQVYTEMQKAVRLLKVDMTAAMSIVITYTDNDGD